MDNARKLTFTAQPIATMRRPIFQGNDDLQRAWNELWNARLEVFGCVMPWLREAINGIPEGANGTDELQHQLTYLDARKQYEAGTRATKYVEQVKAIHERQNNEWRELTGMEPLGTIDDWRAAAAAAGVPPAEFERHGFDRLAKLVSAWAVAKRANTTEPAKPNATDPATTNATANGATDKATADTHFDAETRALAVMAQHPEITSITGIARQAGCTREHLSKNCPRFKTAWNVATKMRKQPRRIVRGAKDKNGTLEAWHYDDENECEVEK